MSESICILVCGTKLEKAINDSCKAPVLHSTHLKHHKGLNVQDNKTPRKEAFLKKIPQLLPVERTATKPTLVHITSSHYPLPETQNSEDQGSKQQIKLRSWQAMFRAGWCCAYLHI